MRQDLYHHCLLDMFLAACHHSHLYSVAIQRKHRVTLRNKDRFASIIGLERVFAISLTDKGTLLYLCLQVQTIRVITHFRQIVIPCHLLHQVDSQHLGWMGIQLQGFEYLLERECLVRILLKQSLQHFCNLLLIQSLSTFFLTHNRLFYNFHRQRYKLFHKCSCQLSIFS